MNEEEIGKMRCKGLRATCETITRKSVSALMELINIELSGNMIICQNEVAVSL
jgi:hypothetical protein